MYTGTVYEIFLKMDQLHPASVAEGDTIILLGHSVVII